MGQTVSMTTNKQSQGYSVHNSTRLSFRAKRATRPAMKTLLYDDMSSKSTVWSEESQQRHMYLFWDGRVGPSQENVVAAGETANAFFVGSELEVRAIDNNSDDDVHMLYRRPRGKAADGLPPSQVNIVISNSGSPTPSRSSSRPVKCPPQSRNGLPIGRREGHDDHECGDSQYLERLYEMRTWDMYIRITEARKKQSLPIRNHVPESRRDSEWFLQEPNPESLKDSLEHEMIFSCDLE